jgi:para-aminobenzoate synthetase/4-amino-4-deoxychorismate lyase
MTSTVSCETHACFTDIMTAMFPCASVTGAPKASTMEIIRRAESEPRKVYTGCVGFLSPQRQAQFNVAIRTVLIDTQHNEAEFGVGGGVVWDSTAGDEFAECHLKAGVLTQSQKPFELLETMLWTPKDGYFLLQSHLKRLAQSAEYFGFPFSEHAIRSKLYAAVPVTVDSPKRVRLLLGEDGHLHTEVVAFDGATEAESVSIRLARSPVDSSDPFLYHKTTRRDVYEGARAACDDCDDVLLWNEKGEITETCIANVVLKINGENVTPPTASGLLAGTFRQWLIETGKVTEKVIKKEDVASAECLWVVNSVRKWREATIAVGSVS